MNLPDIRTIPVLLTLFAACQTFATTAHSASTYTVTTTMDETVANSNCSLREAILAANGTLTNTDCAIRDNGAPYTINFATSGTILLGSALPKIARSMSINGVGQNITVSGNNALQVFSNNAGVTLNLQNITVANGRVSLGAGAGISNAGTLNVSNCTITGNSGSGTTGGGFYNTGTLAVSNSTISGNYSSEGGGIYNSGTTTITSSTVSGNSCFTYGGGIKNEGTMTVINSTVSGNSASSALGGGIYNAAGRALNVTGSTISFNTCMYGCGIFNLGTMNVTNSTFSGNNGGNGASINNNGSTIVRNCTFSGNRAGMGAGIYNTGSASFTNSIIANSSYGGNCYGSVSGTSNLSDDSSCSSAFLGSNIIRLGPLGSYGGPSQTIPLLPGSVAINLGNSSTCASSPVSNLDQRGVARPSGNCDIGAYESRGFTLMRVSGNGQSTLINSNFPDQLIVELTETNGSPLPGAAISFSAPASGASTNPAAFSATTDASGTVAVTATANGIAGGPYSVIASPVGVTGVGFSLTNLAAALLSITFNGDGSGTVTSTAPASPVINCIKGSARGCSAGFPLNSSVTLAATSDWKSVFEKWGGSFESSLNPVTFDMSSDRAISVEIEPNYIVKLFPGGSLFAAIQDAYATVAGGTITIQAQVSTFMENLLFNKSVLVILNGGMDSSFTPTAGYSSVKSLTVATGQTVISNININ